MEKIRYKTRVLVNLPPAPTAGNNIPAPTPSHNKFDNLIVMGLVMSMLLIIDIIVRIIL